MSITRGITELTAPIYVTKPLLPPLHELLPHLERIWESRFLTNGGHYHAALETALCRFLGVEHISLFANGTLALITALQAMDLRGEVITTPYSFVATSHALLWNHLEPVFVDIDPKTMNLDPAHIEAAITSRTSAILPVHCYGHACDVEAIQAVADAHGLKVLYDAAHAFGVRWRDRSILCHGDLSVLSFHATKVFNTFEGGAIVSRDAETKARIDRLKNFGMTDDGAVLELGQNGKMSEFNAALGLVQLDHVEAAMARRRRIDAVYRSALADAPGIRCVEGCDAELKNCAYFPILVEPTARLDRDALCAALREHDIWARRYFHPLISAFPMYADLPSALPGRLPVAQEAASQVLCLPIYPDLTDEEQAKVIQVIRQACKA